MTDIDRNSARTDPRYFAEHGLQVLGMIFRPHLTANYSPPAAWLDSSQPFNETQRFQEAYRQCPGYYKPLPYETRQLYQTRLLHGAYAVGIDLPSALITAAYNSWVVTCPEDWPLFPKVERPLVVLYWSANLQTFHHTYVHSASDLGKYPNTWHTVPLVNRPDKNHLTKVPDASKIATERYIYQACTRFTHQIPIPYEQREQFEYRMALIGAPTPEIGPQNLRYIYTTWLTNPKNIHILPLDSEGDYVRSYSEAMDWTRDQILGYKPPA
jgi:hypothetical protein